MANNGRREWIEQHAAVLASSDDRAELEVAAVQLAAADDPEALDRLGDFLSKAEFLRRLDDVSEPGEKTLHLRSVLAPLIERPSPEVAQLCLRLANDPVFLEDDDRQSFLLQALARVTPMSESAADLFRRTNEEGYFAFNARLLAANASTLALELFASMMEDKEVPSERRVDCLHMSIVPQRTRLPVLQLTMELLAKHLEEPVDRAVIESVFHFEWQWFGTHPPEPPAWRSAPNDVLRFLMELGAQAERRPNLPASLQTSINTTVGIARALLARRGA